MKTTRIPVVSDTPLHYRNKSAQRLRLFVQHLYGGKCSKCGDERLASLRFRRIPGSSLETVERVSVEWMRRIRTSGVLDPSVELTCKACIGSESESERRNRLWEVRRRENLCVYCGSSPPLPSAKGCAICQSKVRSRSRKHHEGHPGHDTVYRKRIKTEVLAKYGGVCTCCGETREAFLTIDHVNRDGAAERRELYGTQSGSSYSFYLKLKREPRSNRYQVLCYNCNHASYHGVCPHKLVETSNVGDQKADPS